MLAIYSFVDVCAREKLKARETQVGCSRMCHPGREVIQVRPPMHRVTRVHACPLDESSDLCPYFPWLLPLGSFLDYSLWRRSKSASNLQALEVFSEKELQSFYLSVRALFSIRTYTFVQTRAIGSEVV